MQVEEWIDGTTIQTRAEEDGHGTSYFSLKDSRYIISKNRIIVFT